jgi:hypothetical protein
MSHQGYLILHEKRQAPKVVYVMLQDGIITCFASTKCEIKLKEVPLTGCKLEIKAQKRADGVPNSFFLESRFVKINGATYTLDIPIRIEFSASSIEERQKWGKAFFSWRRFFWRETRNPQEEEIKLQNRNQKIKLDQMLSEYFEANPRTTFIQPLSYFKHPPHHGNSTSSKTKASTTATATNTYASECEKEKIILSKIAYTSTAATTTNMSTIDTTIIVPTTTVA